MTTLDQLLMRTACNVIQWIIDRYPAPENEARITEATKQLAAARQALHASISNAGN